MRSDSPSPKTNVASEAISVGVEAGYNIFKPMKIDRQQLYVFARYDYYDSMLSTTGGLLKYDWCGRSRDAYETVRKFRALSKEDRDAVVTFLDAI